MRVAPSKFDLSLAHLRSCPRTALNAMVSSLEKQGQLNPVVSVADQDRMILVDGFKRQQAATILGMEQLSAVAIPLNKPLMKAYIYLLNHNRGFSLIEECLLLREIVEKDGLTQGEAAIMLERHKSWVSRRMDLLRRLEPRIVEDVRLGLLPPGSVRSLARLPLCNQGDMGAAIQRDRLKVKEIHRLVDLWCKADTPERKRFLVESSHRALDLYNEDSRLSSPIPVNLNAFLEAFQGLERIACALARRSRSGLGALSPENQALILDALQNADRQCRQAFEGARAALYPNQEDVHEQTS